MSFSGIVLDMRMVLPTVPDRTKRAGFFKAIMLGGFLLPIAGCSLFSPPPVAATPPPKPLPALALLQAEAQGYAEGLAAGKRIQAKHDEIAAANKQREGAKPPTSPQTASLPPVPANPTVTYDSAGPAVPMGPLPRSGSCTPAALPGIAVAQTRDCAKQD